MVKTAKPTPEAQAFEPSDNDIIDDIMCRVIAMAPGFSAAIARQIAADTREQWGGDRPYIARKAGQGTSTRNESIKRDFAAGERMPLLERRYNLKRSRLWEILKS